MSYDDAATMVASHLPPTLARRSGSPKASFQHRVEAVPLLAGLHRVLAENIVADRDLPPFPRATRDGFAVRSTEAAAGARLRVIGEVRAGSPPPTDSSSAPADACFEIMTGAAVPAGFDAVVMVEHTHRTEDLVTLDRPIDALQNIVPRASEAKAGDALLTAGSRVGYRELAVAASAGAAQLKVYRPPKVAVLTTGDELVAVNELPAAHQIRNSNAHSLAAQVLEAGGEPVILPIAPDVPARLEQAVLHALAVDTPPPDGPALKGVNPGLLLISGGVSMGRFDLVERVLQRLGAEFFFTGVTIQPGKPTVFGRCRGRYFFGLPGNPVSTMVTFELFARPMVRRLSGEVDVAPKFALARLATEVRTRPGLTRFLPARISGTANDTCVEVIKWQGSGDIVAAARGNCFAVVPPEAESLRAGTMVSVLLS